MTKGMDGGRLLMRMAWRGGRVVAVSAETRRPSAAQLLRGRTPAEALALVPRVFSLCGKAQAAACRAACAAADGKSAAPGGVLQAMHSRVDDARIALEAGQEHLWRLLLDWPRMLGLVPREAEFVSWHKRLAAAGKTLDAARAVSDPETTDTALAGLAPLAAALRDFLDAVLFAPAQAGSLLRGDALPADSWAGHLLAAAACDVQSAPVRVRLLPAMSADKWTARLAHAAADFSARPTFDDAPAETGPLARHAEHPLVAAQLADGYGVAARLAARLVDLAELPGQLAQVPARIEAAGASGHGLACVETARGTLIHAVRLEAGRVADYTVIAPTEWNFHPDGCWRAELLGQPVADAATGEQLLRRVALALDPCVPVAVEVNEGAGLSAAPWP